MAQHRSLGLDELVERLEHHLEVEFTYRDVEPYARALLALPRERQQHALDWIRRITSTHLELGYRFAARARDAFERMEPALIETWVLYALDRYDRLGLLPALEVMSDLDGFLEQGILRSTGVMFDDVAPVLLHFLHGLSGRTLELAWDAAPWTDTSTVYLPEIVARLESRQDNFLTLKGITTHLWAQTRFGTFRAPLAERFPNPTAAGLERFHALERLRLDGCIARELPGLYREIERLRRLLDEPEPTGPWRDAAQHLHDPNATVFDSLALIARLARAPRFEPGLIAGRIDPGATADAIARRQAREKALFRVRLAELVAAKTEEVAAGDPEQTRPPEVAAKRRSEPDAPGETRVELTLAELPLALPPPLGRLLTSIVIDFGDLPPDYLVPAGPGDYDLAAAEERTLDPDTVWQGTYHEEGAFFYDEWDFRRQHYRKNWCVVREVEPVAVDDDFVARTRERHRGLIAHLRRIFEAMRDREQILKRQRHGDGIDIDAFVEGWADARAGLELSDRLFTRLQKDERDIAVVLMVDMSGSTRGWVNDAERETLVLMAESLEALGDRYAIYGFTGITRQRCDIYRIKTFEQRYDRTVEARISGVRPGDYTRMGPAIRHLSALLREQPARTRLLVTLSDGRPEDYRDDYAGEYAVEDTRQALVEARRDGIHPFCITIDERGQEYLPHMYGAASYVVIDRVEKLPQRVPEIYRRLTS